MRTSDDQVLSGPIGSTFFFYSASSMVGLVAITTLSLVDGVFVGRYVGADALAALTLLLPWITVQYAVALMFGIGGSVVAGRHLGAGEQDVASRVFSQTLLATFVASLAFAVLSWAFAGRLYEVLQVPSELRGLVAQYFDVMRWVIVLQMETMVLYYFARTDGHPLLATTALVVGALANIGLAALFVGELRMGVRGAAYAVAVAQLIQAGILGGYLSSPLCKLRPCRPRRSWKELARTAYCGLSEFTNELSAGLVFWVLNGLLLTRLGVAGVAAFTVVNYFVFVSLMVSYGVADALHPLVSQNHGARNHRRIGQFLRVAFVSALVLGAFMALALVVFRTSLTGSFVGQRDADIARRAADLTLVIWPLFLVNQANVVLSCYLTAIERATPAAFIAALRGLVLPVGLLLAFVFPLRAWTLSSELAEWSFLVALPLAEWLTLGVALYLTRVHRPQVLADRVVWGGT